MQQIKRCWQILIDRSLESKVPCFFPSPRGSGAAGGAAAEKTLSQAQYFALVDLFLGLSPSPRILTPLLKPWVSGQPAPPLRTFRNVKS